MKTLTIDSDTDFTTLGESLSRLDSGGKAERILEEKTEAARAIVDSVREYGDAAVAEFTRDYDGVDLKPAQFEVTAEEIDAAIASVDPELLATLERAQENIRRFHTKHLRQSWEEEDEDGIVLGQRVTPIESAGVYVPGGKAFYPSTVLMNIVPARVAGVKEIVMVSPPSHEGTIHPVVLAAARIAQATRVFRVGGAQSIAALAFGTEHIPKVLKITGPGNTYVTLAKRLVRPFCDIDTEAGPSEVVVIADENANPRFAAGELLAQAEHDEEARCILITPSQTLADAVLAALKAELESLSRPEIIRQALDNYGAIVIVSDLDEAVRVSNRIAPEHLAIYTSEPRAILEKITNAGCIAVGESTTVALGDYFAGPNHILPTSGRARFASPLTAEDFRKVSSVLEYTPEAVNRVGGDVRRLAEIEGLTAHARTIEMRQ